MSKRFRVTTSEGISVAIEFNGDEVHIIANFSTNSANSTTLEHDVQMKEKVDIATPDIQRGKTTELTEEQISMICNEYATTSFRALMKKYHISSERLYSILNENSVQIRKQGQRTPLAKGKYTQLSDEQIALIGEEYATTSILALRKKYHISSERLYSILNENGIQLKKQRKRPVASEKASVKTYDLEKVDSIIDKREVHELRRLYHAINNADCILPEELVKEHKFPIEFLEFATSEFELFTQKFILKMYKMGYSIEAISTRVKKPANQVRQLIPDSIIRGRGDKSHSVLTGERLKDSEKQAIRKCFSNGESINDLADRFGVSPQTIKRYAL